jgi:hypothetical protein
LYRTSKGFQQNLAVAGVLKRIVSCYYQLKTGHTSVEIFLKKNQNSERGILSVILVTQKISRISDVEMPVMDSSIKEIQAGPGLSRSSISTSIRKDL